MLLAVAAVLFMQVGPAPIPIPAQPQAPAPAPVMTTEQFGALLYDGGGLAAGRFAEDGFRALDTVWNLPDFLVNSRRPENTVDQPDAALLNNTMVRLLPGLMIVAFVLVLGANALSVMTGNLPNPVALLGGISVVAVAGLVAVNNRWFQHFPIDLVNLLLTTISGAPIREFAAPGMHLAGGVALMWAALFAVAFALMMMFLTVVLFIEGAWCIVLGSQAAIFTLGSALPIFGSGSQYILRRWIGSLFSPVIVFAALKLMSAIVANLPSGTPDLGLQLLMIAFGAVAWQAPGLMVGAIAVSFPGIAQMYFAGRLVGLGRVTERGISRDGGGARPDPPRTRSGPPVRTSSHGMGGGTAVTRRMAARA